MKMTFDISEAYRRGSGRRARATTFAKGARAMAMATVLTAMAGCAGSASAPATAAKAPAAAAAAPTPVAIADFRAVAGRWAGPVSGLASRRTDEDWVELAIADDGSYDFGIARNIGMFAGKGRFTLDDGKLIMAGERGRATYALYEGGGRRDLRANGVLANGTPMSAELTPKR